jgi:hypothetical protein
MAGPVRGQVTGPNVGDRVRVHTIMRPHRVEGTVLRVTPDTLVLVQRGEPALGSQLVIPLGSLQALDVGRGRRSEWRSGAVIGSFAGFVTASAIFAARMQRCVGWECGKSAEWLPVAAAGSLAGAAGGALVGLLIRHDRWERVVLNPGVPLVTLAGDRVGLQLSLRF